MSALVSLLTGVAIRLLRMALRSRLVMGAVVLALGGGALQGGIAGDVGERVERAGAAARASLPDIERPRLPSVGRSGGRGVCAGRKRVVVVRISHKRFPLVADHARDAVRSGEPMILTLERTGADRRRAAWRRAQGKAFPSRSDEDRDEYPPALSAEGGARTDLRYVEDGENQGAGASMGSQLRGVPNGRKFCVSTGLRGLR